MERTVMFLHGAWMTPHSWKPFVGRFESANHPCIAPAWPHIPDSPALLSQSGPDPELAKIGIMDLVDHYERQIKKLDEVPILVGHSFGGLVVQLLLDRGLGAAGVALDPAPVQGVRPGLTASLASLAVLRRWMGWRKVHHMSPRSFAWAFANALTPAQQRVAYREHVVPAPGRIFFEAAFGRGTKIDFDNPVRPPLLLAVGSADRTVQSSMVRKNYQLARRNAAPTEFRKFEGRCHFLIGQSGWEEVADYVIDWCRRMEATHAIHALRGSSLRLSSSDLVS